MDGPYTHISMENIREVNADDTEGSTAGYTPR